jgi:hypothetical protein
MKIFLSNTSIKTAHASPLFSAQFSILHFVIILMFGKDNNTYYYYYYYYYYYHHTERVEDVTIGFILQHTQDEVRWNYGTTPRSLLVQAS